MNIFIKRIMFLFIIITIIAVVGVGCSNTNNKNQSNSANNNSDNNLNNSSQISTDTLQKNLIENIKQLAIKGKVINSEFMAKTNTIDDVEKQWGKANNTDYIAKAKGNYATYTDKNIVFGLNKGMQIFEVRSYDPQINKITMSQIKQVLGMPQYDVKVNGEEIIGYVMSDDFKLLFVFPEPSQSTKDPYLKHYSVLYPKGTVNNMSEDRGREW